MNTAKVIEAIVSVIAEAVPVILKLWTVTDKPYLTEGQVDEEIKRIIAGQGKAEARENAIAEGNTPP
jgi:hypothetical protein